MSGTRDAYMRANRPVTSTVTSAEHAHIAALARQAGQPTTTYVTAVLRAHLAARRVMPAAKIDAAEVA